MFFWREIDVNLYQNPFILKNKVIKWQKYTWIACHTTKRSSHRILIAFTVVNRQTDCEINDTLKVFLTRIISKVGDWMKISGIGIKVENALKWITVHSCVQQKPEENHSSKMKNTPDEKKNQNENAVSIHMCIIRKHGHRFNNFLKFDRDSRMKNSSKTHKKNIYSSTLPKN